MASVMAVEIVYETHATTTDNEASVATGWLVDTRTMPAACHREGRRKHRERYREGLTAAELGGVSGGDQSLGDRSKRRPCYADTLAVVRTAWTP